MKRILSFGIIVILLFGLVIFFGLTKKKNPLSEKESIDLIVKTITKDSLYESFATPQCISYKTDDESKEFFIISAYELHNNNCKGDPSTQPRIDTFKIIKQTKDIYYYNILKDSYSPYDSTKLKR